MVYIPDRLMEGYGPSGAALVELKRRGASLAVTVDCGAQAFEALQEAADAGLEVIVCDHHQCATSLPIAHAMINPNRLDEGEIGSAHGHVAAVGMAFLLGVALLRELRGRGRFAVEAEPKLIDLLDIVALGTVADVARLKTLNRAFVTQGLKVMAERRNIGLVALAEASRLVKPPSSRDLGFALGPADQRRRTGRQVRPWGPAADDDRSGGSAKHRRRARPAQRRAARDRDGGHRASY